MSAQSAREEVLFNAAVQLPAGKARAAFLDQACADDPPLRQRVEALLREHDQCTSFLEPQLHATVVGREASTGAAHEEVGQRIGHFKLLQKIGEGGCGVVYMAEQLEPVRRRVALKIIKLGMDTKSVIARFEAEQQALALMDHPNIAKVLDAGATDSGRPYFVMELVRGTKITEYCDAARVSTRGRLELFLKVCQAIQHAHQKGIIHRDIKPSNILVTVSDGVAVPKVIDFGIAKATSQQQLTDKTLFTAFDQFIGTPAYMSPEQAVMTSIDVDTRSDIYSLGVLLYELLTGQTPFDLTVLMKAGLEEICRTLRDQEPPRPSTRLSTLLDAELGVTAANRHEDSVKLISLLRGDLDWIVMKCLEKDRQRRYETANGLAADIQRHLSNEPITARPPSVAYRFQKLVRRNKLAFGASAAVAVALVAGLAVSTWQAVSAFRAWKAADAARAAEARERALAQTERDRAQAAAAQAELARQGAERNAYAAAMGVAQNDWEHANMGHLQRVLEETSPFPEKGFEWFFWQRMSQMEAMTFRDHDASVSAVSYSPDGSRMASASQDRTVRIRDSLNGQVLRILRGHAARILSVAFSTDGKYLITVASDGTARIWDATTGTPTATYYGSAAALAPDGQTLLLAAIDGRVTLLDAASGQPRAELGRHDEFVTHLAFSPDGARMLSVSLGGPMRMWKRDAAAPPKQLWSNPRPAWAWEVDRRPVAFSPDSKQLACGGRDRVVRILEADTGMELKAMAGHQEEVNAVAFSPDGLRVASAGLDRTIQVWDAEKGTHVLTLKGHSDRVTAVAFSPDSRRLVSGSEDRTVRIWDAAALRCPRLSPPHPSSYQLVRFSPDGQRILTASRDGTARIWDAASLTELRVLRGHTDALSHATFSPDGERVSTGAHDSTLRLWDAATGQELRQWHGGWGIVYWSRISHDGTKLLSSMEDGAIRIWDVSTGEKLQEWKAHVGGVWTVEYSPDDTRIVSSGGDGLLKIWEAATERELSQLRGHIGLVIPLALSPDGSKIASGGADDRTVRIWDAAEGRELAVLRGHTDKVWDVNFSPDCQRLVSGALDKTVRIWDVVSGRELLTLRGHSDYVMAASFSPDGERLVCGGDSPSFEVWETASPSEIAQRSQQEGEAVKRWAEWDRQVAARLTMAQTNLIKSWLISGPLQVDASSSAAAQIRTEQLPREARLRPKGLSSFRGGPKALVWREARFDDGIIDFNRFFGPGDHRAMAAYAVCYVKSNQARKDLRLKVGSDDQSRLYLNGKLLYEHALGGSLQIDRDTIAGVELEAGSNVVVFKVINDYGGWSGSLRFVDEQDQPVTEIEFSTSPD